MEEKKIGVNDLFHSKAPTLSEVMETQLLEPFIEDKHYNRIKLLCKECNKENKTKNKLLILISIEEPGIICYINVCDLFRDISETESCVKKIFAYEINENNIYEIKDLIIMENVIRKNKIKPFKGELIYKTRLLFLESMINENESTVCQNFVNILKALDFMSGENIMDLYFERESLFKVHLEAKNIIRKMISNNKIYVSKGEIFLVFKEECKIPNIYIIDSKDKKKRNVEEFTLCQLLTMKVKIITSNDDLITNEIFYWIYIYATFLYPKVMKRITKGCLG